MAKIGFPRVMNKLWKIVLLRVWLRETNAVKL